MPLVVLTVVLFLAGWVPFAAAEEPVNLDFRKQEIVRYHDSGAYDYDIHKVISHARAYLKQRVAENARQGKNAKLAMVLDIDETSLSNWSSLLELRFGGNPRDDCG